MFFILLWFYIIYWAARQDGLGQCKRPFGRGTFTFAEFNYQRYTSVPPAGQRLCEYTEHSMCEFSSLLAVLYKIYVYFSFPSHRNNFFYRYTMDLQTAFEECEVAMRKFFNNDLVGASNIMKPWLV